jgi:hypothetical protein
MAKAPREIRSLARCYTNTAIHTLVGVMTNPKAMSSAKVAAAKEILNRGYGAVTNEDGLAADNRVIVNILQLTQQAGGELPGVVVQRLTNGAADHA